MANVKQKPPKERKRTLIDSWDEVPKFETEAEEQAWWDCHDLGDALVERFQRVPLEGDSDLLPARHPTRSKPVTVRFETDVIKRLKEVAEKKEMGYQTLLKAFVLERLYEEEKREGMVQGRG